jgi:hypothetical protein
MLVKWDHGYQVRHVRRAAALSPEEEYQVVVTKIRHKSYPTAAEAISVAETVIEELKTSKKPLW